MAEKERNFGISFLNNQGKYRLCHLSDLLEGGRLIKNWIYACGDLLGEQCSTHFPGMKHLEEFFWIPLGVFESHVAKR